MNTNDMTAKEFFTAPESPLTLDFLNPEEQETFLNAVELYAKGKVHQAPKTPTIESIKARAEELYPMESKKEYNQATIEPYVPYFEYAGKIELQQEAFITGAKEFSSAVGEGGWIDVKDGLPEREKADWNFSRDVKIRLDDGQKTEGYYHWVDMNWYRTENSKHPYKKLEGVVSWYPFIVKSQPPTT